MARYTHLTIFQKSYDLTVRIYKEVRNFPREYKYSLGKNLQNTVLDLIGGVIEANSEENKTFTLKKVVQQVEKLRILVRICYSLNVIGGHKYEVLSKYIDEVGKMTGGWLKSS